MNDQGFIQRFKVFALWIFPNTAEVETEAWLAWILPSVSCAFIAKPIQSLISEQLVGLEYGSSKFDSMVTEYLLFID